MGIAKFFVPPRSSRCRAGSPSTQGSLRANVRSIQTPATVAGHTRARGYQAHQTGWTQLRYPGASSHGFCREDLLVGFAECGLDLHSKVENIKLKPSKSLAQISRTRQTTHFLTEDGPPPKVSFHLKTSPDFRSKTFSGLKLTV